MTRPALIDVNVLLPLLLPQHPAHSSARDWLQAQPAGIGRFSLLTQLGVLRLLSQPRVMGTAVLKPERALQTWHQLVQAVAMEEISIVPPAHAEHLRRLVAGRAATPNLWTNAWLAALALSLDCEMVTFDRGFRQFPNLRLRLLKGA